MADEIQVATVEPSKLGEFTASTVEPSKLLDTTTSTDTTTGTSIRGTSILDSLGISAQDVLAAPNIQSTLTAPETPVTDALGIFKQQEEAYGIPGLTDAYNQALAKRLEGEQLAKQEQLTIEGRRKKLGVLRGEQSQAAQQAALDISTLLQGEKLAQSALTTAQARAQQAGQILYNEYQTKVNLQLQYPGLDINPLTDSFETVSEKLKEYQEEQEKKAYKEKLKAALQELGHSTGGLNTKQLEKKLAKYNKEALAAAKEKSDLELEKLKIDIENTKSTIANRDNKTETLDLSNKGLSSLIDEEVNAGTSWGYISAKLEAAGVSTASGSPADKYLRYRFLGEENPFKND